MNRLKSSMLVALAAVMMISFSVVTSAPVDAQGSAALSIAPRKNYVIEPGKGVKDTLMVRNIDRERPLHLSLRVVDFTFTDDGGTPKLNLDPDASPTTWSLRPYISVPQSVTIDAGESESIEMNIEIPENRGAGSLYSAIVYSSTASEGGNVGLSASGVTLVFTNIPGEVDEKLILEKLGAYDSVNKKYKLFNMDMPVRMAYTLRNEGNVTESPVGSIVLRNPLFGREHTINDINVNKSLALIGQTRTFETCIVFAKETLDFAGNRQEATTCADAGLWPGYYSVELMGFYGQNGNNTQELIGKGRFFYIPLWFLVIVIIVLLFASYHIWRIIRHFRGGKSGKMRAPRGKK